jgi:thioredoxin reductase (NADPH)
MADAILDVIIIGAGPAGMTAGIYCVRAGLKTLILERAFPGGQVVKTGVIENYPGFPQGVTGFDLAQLMQQQAAKFGAEVRILNVKALRPDANLVRVESAGPELTARTVIVATGSEPKLLGVPGESRLYGRGVSSCAVCDGALFKGKTVAVVGGGDAALGEALYLSNLCAKVYVLHRRNQFRAAKVLQERVLNRSSIETIWNATVQEVIGENRVEGIEVMDVKYRTCHRVAIDGLFVYVGARPNTEFLKAVVTLDEQGYVVADATMKTSQPRILACGDCRQKSLRQVSTAVGDGALAASTAERILALGISQT